MKNRSFIQQLLAFVLGCFCGWFISKYFPLSRIIDYLRIGGALRRLQKK